MQEDLPVCTIISSEGCTDEIMKISAQGQTNALRLLDAQLIGRKDAQRMGHQNEPKGTREEQSSISRRRQSLE